MKILHVIASLAPRYGGPSKACMDMATALAERGHEVHVFTTDHDGAGRLDVPTDRPVTAQSVQVHHFRSTLRRIWPISLPLASALAKQTPNFDVVHIHSTYQFYGAVASHYCRKFMVPYVVRPHGTLDPYLFQRHRFRKRVYEALIERRNYRGAAGIHFTADDEQRLAPSFARIAPGFVVPLALHSVDYANLPGPGHFRAKYPEIGTRKIVLHLGRLNFKKGLDILVDAFAKISNTRDDVHLVLAGPDNEGYGAQITRRVGTRGLAGRVTFTGMLQGELKLAALRDASVFALPSYAENFGIGVVESMACGLPVVISDRVNIWREVERGGTGFVTSCDSDACASSLLAVLNDDTAARLMGENGRRLVSERFDWSAVGAQLEAMYREVASKGLRFRAASPPAAAPE